jgi:enamine deaminase RidA (YjgF/YER057c/UK114 family)
MNTKKISSGSPYEPIVGYSRAVRTGRMIFVSGTAPMDPDGSTVFPGDLYLQTRRCLEIIREAIESLGGTIDDVVRTRVYLTDASRWEEAGKAHGELFGEIRPASTFVEVSRLLRDDWLVEIEAECVVKDL